MFLTRRYETRSILIVLCFFVVSTSGFAALDPQTIQTVNQELIPSYQRGNVRGLLDTTCNVIRRMDEDDINALDELLEEQNVPSVGELLVDARLTLIRQQAKRLPRMSPHELRLIVPALSAQITAELDQVQASPVMSAQKSPATSFEQFEDRLWKFHVISNQLRNAELLADFGKTLVRGQKKRRRRRDPEVPNPTVEDVASLSQRIAQLQDDAAEKRFADRIDRLAFALKVLTESDDIKQRYYAAFVGDLDGRLLAESLSGKKGAAAQPDLSKSVREQHEAILSAAGEDLVQKSQWLFVGMHWWLRGRYGRGPDGNGMLKDAMVLRSPEAMFGLHMPIETPQPTDPQLTDTYSVPEIDRRHHYMWMYQYRKIQGTAKTLSVSNTTGTPTSRTKLTHFY